MSQMPKKSELKKNLRALKARLERKPLDLDARMRIARTHRLLGDKKPAVEHYIAVARFLSLAGQPLQAIAVLKELLQVEPQHEETLHFLAKLYARTGVTSSPSRKKVAAAVAEPRTGPIALPDGLPTSPSAVWNAIRPMATDVYTVVLDNGDLEVMASEDQEISVANELRELEDTLDLGDDDILEEAPRDAASTRGGAPSGDASEAYEFLDEVSSEHVLLPQVPLFSSLPPAAFVDLGKEMVFRRAQEGEVIFEEGAPGDSFIVLASGRARASRVAEDGHEIELMQLGTGDFAGLFALLSAQKRNARLTALSYVEYFEIGQGAVDALVEKHPQVKLALAHFFRERLLQNLLAVLPCFSSLSAEDRLDLVRRLKNKEYEEEDDLFYQGFEHDGLWVVLEGKIHVGKEGLPPEQTLVPGDYVGSFAGVDGAATELCAIAGEHAVVALLSHKVFGDILKEHPDLSEVRRAFADAGMMLTEHVFAGNGRLPGRLVNLRPVFR